VLIKKFSNSDDLAKILATEILTKLKKNKKFNLGCPGGRSLTKTYYYLGQLSYRKKISLQNLNIIMMDEYVLKKNGKFKLINSKSHNSCVRFSKQVIKRLLNYKKNKNQKLKDKNIYFPEIHNPKNYDIMIKRLGGIDLFLLASGSSDGHVAFNNSNTTKNSKTHVIKLSSSTRKDNMKTFPNFKSLNEVPKFGLTVGLKTITELSKSAVLVLTGKEKNHAFFQTIVNKRFYSKWPASIIYDCKKPKIYRDKLEKN
tara:strand:+ start:7602 stop:8369 length:768 start_codon:yes stop_codon:yes gene_type:complete